MPKIVTRNEIRTRVSVNSNGDKNSSSNTREHYRHRQYRGRDYIKPKDQTTPYSKVTKDSSDKHIDTQSTDKEAHLHPDTKRSNIRSKEKEKSFTISLDVEANKRRHNNSSSGHSKNSRRENRFRASNDTRPDRPNYKVPAYGPRVDQERPSTSSSISNREYEHNNKKRKRVETPVKKTPIGRDLPPWLKYAKTLTGDNYEMLHQEIKHFVEYISPSPEEHEMRFMVYKCIEQVIHSLWPKAEVKLFGSYDTQLYLPTSDIDMVIFLPELGSNKKACLYMLARALEQARIATNIRVVAKARVPIIKFQEIITRYHIDISFNVENGVQSVPIIKELIDKNAGVRPLVLLLKQFLMLRGLNEVYNGGLGSYSTLLIVVNFLQLHPKVSTGQLDPEKDLGQLLVDLLYLYGKKFNYKQDGISVNGDGSYFDKVEKGWTNVKDSRLLSIEDPQDPNNDVSKGSFEIMRVKQAFSSAYDSLISLLSSHATSGDHSKTQQHNDSNQTSNEKNSLPEDKPNKSSSILDIVITISPGAMRNRLNVAAEYRNSTLQNHLKLQTSQELQTELEEVLKQAHVSSLSIFDKLGPIPSQSELYAQESEEFFDQDINHYESEDYESGFRNFYQSPQMAFPPYYNFNRFPPYPPNMNVNLGMPMGMPGANIGNNMRMGMNMNTNMRMGMGMGMGMGVGMNMNRGPNMGMGMNMPDFPSYNPYFNPMPAFGHGNNFGRASDPGVAPPPWSRGPHFPRW
ncbi:hypothetical protein K7432_010824 [Basidiobolus ranarum]|uniref:polynucleotide adenylyltransferase n=1 Tax=Basidiobolus ranarum TaxID=34480 RepID=A0ABR2WN41_9FUNG